MKMRRSRRLMQDDRCQGCQIYKDGDYSKGKKQTVGGGTGRSGENLLAFAVK